MIRSAISFPVRTEPVPRDYPGYDVASARMLITSGTLPTTHNLDIGTYYPTNLREDVQFEITVDWFNNSVLCAWTNRAS